MSSQPTNKTIVISLGGSIVVPEKPDPVFVSDFVQTILKFVEEGYRFCIIVGGGKTARVYQDALKESISTDMAEVDWMGIFATRLNAEFVRLSFGGIALPQVIWHPFDSSDFEKYSVVIGAGHEPGNSSDLGAVLAACEYGAGRVINLSNISYVYSQDPKDFPDAEKFETISWSEYLKLVPSEWVPGMSTPFDPVASRKAKECGIEVAMIYGKNLESMRNYIQNRPFEGTKIYD